MGSIPPALPTPVLHVVDEPGRPTGRRQQDILYPGKLTKSRGDFRHILIEAEHVDVRAGINSVAGRKALLPPGADSAHDLQAGRKPVVEGGTGGHHYGVHHVRVELDDAGKQIEIALEDGAPAKIKTARGIRKAGSLQRACGGEGVTFGRASLFMGVADDGNAVDKRPMGRLGNG